MRRIGCVTVLMLVLAGPGVVVAAPTTASVVLTDFTFDPPTLRLRVGDEVSLTVRNDGRTAHEWLIGRGLVRTVEEQGFQQDLLALLNPRIDGSQYNLEQVGRRPPGRDSGATRSSRGISILPGGTVTLRFTVPANVKGEWAMACFLPGHYESGMHGTLVIE